MLKFHPYSILTGDTRVESVAYYTLIHFAKFSAKIVLMAKLLQNNSNLNGFECSRYLKARKIEKRQKKIWRPNEGQRWKNPNFRNFFNFLRLIGSKNLFQPVSAYLLTILKPSLKTKVIKMVTEEEMADTFFSVCFFVSFCMCIFPCNK